MSDAAKELPAEPLYGKGMIYGGRWFRDVETGAVWRLVAPDPPSRGLWEPVVPNARGWFAAESVGALEGPAVETLQAWSGTITSGGVPEGGMTAFRIRGGTSA